MGFLDIFGIGSAVSSASNILIAQRQMDFQERMSNTAHQREVKDLVAAGLNPMLSAKLGGSSTPPGASGYVNDLSQAMGRGITADKESSAKDLIKEQTKTQAQLTEKAKADMNLSWNHAEIADVARVKADIQKNILQGPSGKALVWGEMASPSVRAVSGVLGAAGVSRIGRAPSTAKRLRRRK